MLLRFFEFDAWANRETLRSLEAMTNPPERAVALIAHIAAPQRVWLERALSLPQSVAVWPEWSLSETAKELSGGSASGHASSQPKTSRGSSLTPTQRDRSFRTG